MGQCAITALSLRGELIMKQMELKLQGPSVAWASSKVLQGLHQCALQGLHQRVHVVIHLGQSIKNPLSIPIYQPSHFPLGQVSRSGCGILVSK